MKKLTTESHWRNVYYIKKKQKKMTWKTILFFVPCSVIQLRNVKIQNAHFSN